MSEVPRHLPPPPNPALLPILAAITYLAALIGLWGMLSVALDRDIIDYPDAGPLLGPAMAAVGCVVTWVALWRSRASRSPWTTAFAALLVSYFGMLVVGAVGYAVTRGDLSWMLLAAAHFALSPFVAGAALLSGLAVLALAVIRPRKRTDPTR